MTPQINFSNFIKQMIHPLTITVLNLAWYEMLLYPLRNLQARFKNKREADLYRLGHTGQVCYLRGMLNDNFDPVERRITVEDVLKYEFINFFPREDEKAVLFSTQYFANRNFIGINSVNFNVFVPATIGLTPDQETTMRSLLNDYKLVSKRYEIINN